MFSIPVREGLLAPATALESVALLPPLGGGSVAYYVSDAAAGSVHQLNRLLIQLSRLVQAGKHLEKSVTRFDSRAA